MTESATFAAGTFLLGRINYERTPRQAGRRAFKLERMRRLLAELGDPQRRIPAVHIAGTKGKGSTAAMVAAALTAAGIRTGLYTSPHIESFTERLRIDGRSPSPEELDALLPPLAEAVQRLEAESDELSATYFEALTAMAWEYFTGHGAEIVVLEVGLGGRLDATNLCAPEVTAITNISRDHTQILGETTDRIAFEKAGIIKAGVACVSGARDPTAASVIRETAAGRGARLIETAGRYRALPPLSPMTPWRLVVDQPLDPESNFASSEALRVPLRGAHQADNAAVAHFLLESLAAGGWPVGRGDLIEGWRELAFPGRVEVLGAEPTIVLDAAHNGASAAALVQTLEHDFPARRRVLLFAGSQEKDVEEILARLAPAFDAVVLTEFQDNPRAVPLERLEEAWRTVSDRRPYLAGTPAEALQLARDLAGPRDLICATGSFYFVAEVRPLLTNPTLTAS